MTALESRLKKLEGVIGSQQTIKFIVPYKRQFYCGHYLKDGKVIPDGETCCFWHWRGLPRRGGNRHPVYPWQQRIIDDIKKGYRRFAIFKGPKYGATEFILSLYEHLSITGGWLDEQTFLPNWVDGQVGILVGINMPESEFMIERAKDILAHKDGDGKAVRDDKGKTTYRIPLNYSYNNKREFSLNTVKYMAHPAGNYDAIRAKPNMAGILGDEIAFFIKKVDDQHAIRDAFEHYQGSINPLTFLITTAGEVPAGFAHDIWKEPDIDNGGNYRKIVLWPEDGLYVHPESKTSLLDPIEIEKMRTNNPHSFKRNFLHQWGHGVGDAFSQADIDWIESQPAYQVDQRAPKSMGIDPGYGSSTFALVITQLDGGQLQVIYSSATKNAYPDDIRDKIMGLREKYNVTRMYVDGAKPDVIRTLKRLISERTDYLEAIKGYKAQKVDHQRLMQVVPVNFGQEDQQMLDWVQGLVSKHRIVINKENHAELLTELRMAKQEEDGSLDKTQHTMDLTDALLLSCKFFKPRNEPNL